MNARVPARTWFASLLAISGCVAAGGVNPAITGATGTSAPSAMNLQVSPSPIASSQAAFSPAPSSPTPVMPSHPDTLKLSLEKDAVCQNQSLTIGIVGAKSGTVRFWLYGDIPNKSAMDVDHPYNVALGEVLVPSSGNAVFQFDLRSTMGPLTTGGVLQVEPARVYVVSATDGRSSTQIPFEILYGSQAEKGGCGLAVTPVPEAEVTYDTLGASIASKLNVHLSRLRGTKAILSLVTGVRRRAPDNLTFSGPTVVAELAQIAVPGSGTADYELNMANLPVAIERGVPYQIAVFDEDGTRIALGPPITLLPGAP